MKEQLSLEKVLGCDPLTTYLGGGYCDDILHLREITVADTNLTATLSFERSFLANKQGFHLSAINIQMLLPYLCRELAATVLSQKGVSLSSFRVQGTVQEYRRYCTSSEDIQCRVTLHEQERNLSTFSYSIIRPDGKECSLGNYRCLLYTTTEKATEKNSLYHPPAEMRLSSQDTYSLDKIVLHREERSLEAYVGNKAATLTPVQIHGSVGQLMRVLFCSLLGFDRDQVITARASRVVQLYHGPIPEQGYIPIRLQAKREIEVQERKGIPWAMVRCDYSVAHSYAFGELQVAYPLTILSEVQRRTLQNLFVVKEVTE